MLKKNFFYLFVLLFFNIGCSNLALKYHLYNLNKLNPTVKKTNWTISQHYRVSKTTYYCLKKQLKDTSFVLNFSFYKTNFKFNYEVEEFVKRYPENGLFYELSTTDSDTLYELYSNIQKNNHYYLNECSFIQGKYYYMNKYGLLRIGQSIYFDKHRDSLKNIRGNDLPELPELFLPNNDTIEYEEKVIDVK